MSEFLSSPFFKYFLLPLLTALLTIFVKLSSRPDRRSYVTREDFAIGINLCVTAIFVIITKCVIVAGTLISVTDPDKIKRYSDLLLTMVVQSTGMIVLVFILAYIMRKLAWEYDFRSIKMVWGVIIPDIVGLVFLVVSSAQPVE